MTREEFVRAYAKRSGIPDNLAAIGMIEFQGFKQVALPCACSSSRCEGWAMVGLDDLDHHLTFCTPEPMRAAYLNALQTTELAE